MIISVRYLFASVLITLSLAAPAEAGPEFHGLENKSWISGQTDKVRSIYRHCMSPWPEFGNAPKTRLTVLIDPAESLTDLNQSVASSIENETEKSPFISLEDPIHVYDQKIQVKLAIGQDIEEAKARIIERVAGHSTNFGDGWEIVGGSERSLTIAMRSPGPERYLSWAQAKTQRVYCRRFALLGYEGARVHRDGEDRLRITLPAEIGHSELEKLLLPRGNLKLRRLVKEASGAVLATDLFGKTRTLSQDSRIYSGDIWQLKIQENEQGLRVARIELQPTPAVNLVGAALQDGGKARAFVVDDLIIGYITLDSELPRGVIELVDETSSEHFVRYVVLAAAGILPDKVSIIGHS